MRKKYWRGVPLNVKHCVLFVNVARGNRWYGGYDMKEKDSVGH